MRQLVRELARAVDIVAARQFGLEGRKLSGAKTRGGQYRPVVGGRSIDLEQIQCRACSGTARVQGAGIRVYPPVGHHGRERRLQTLLRDCRGVL